MRRSIIALALGSTLGACADYTGVHVQPDFVKAERVPSEWDTAVKAQSTVAPLGPKLPSGQSGAAAIAQAQKQVRIRPRGSEIDGTVWRIDDVDNTKIYVMPVAPLRPTMIMLPVGETLGLATVGSTGDFTTASTVSGDRAALSIMPKCAPQQTKRFVEDDNPDTPFIRPCLTNIAQLTVSTNTNPLPYNFELQVNDWTAAQIVEINHAPPPPTNLVSLKTPRPTGKVEELDVFPEGDWNPGWSPKRCWADPDKMVCEFTAPLPVLPGLYPLGGNVNYSVIETEQTVWMVTSRRVTQAKLMLDEQVIGISSPRAKELLASQNAPRPKDWRD